MKIGIMTFHKAASCGAQLQAWALKRFLEGRRHQVSFPSCTGMGTPIQRWPYRRPSRPGWLKTVRGRWKDLLDNAGSIGIFRPAMEAFDRFRQDNFIEEDIGPEKFVGHYDVVVYGSDQVWNPKLTGADAAAFLGEGVPSDVRKVAYAVSVGDGMPSPADRCRICAAARSFAAISVREPKVIDILSERAAGGERAVVVTDPTFLLKAEDYRDIVVPCHRVRPYLYFYALYHVERAYEMAATLARRMGLDLVYTPLYQYTRRGMPSGTVYGVSPGRFLGYIANAACVLTDSFHGMAFSISNHKPFVAYRLAQDVHESRPGALLGRIGMADRLVRLDTPADSCLTLLQKAPEQRAYEALDEFAGLSRRWLVRALGHDEGDMRS